MSEQRSYQIRMRVPFHDLDPMQVVWHGNDFEVFDVARFGLFAMDCRAGAWELDKQPIG